MGVIFSLERTLNDLVTLASKSTLMLSTKAPPGESERSCTANPTCLTYRLDELVDGLLLPCRLKRPRHCREIRLRLRRPSISTTRGHAAVVLAARQVRARDCEPGAQQEGLDASCSRASQAVVVNTNWYMALQIRANSTLGRLRREMGWGRLR